MRCLFDLIQETNFSVKQEQEQKQGNQKAFLLNKIVTFITRIACVFGLREQDSRLTVGSASSSPSVEFHSVQSLCEIRSQIRQAALAKQPHSVLLDICDHFENQQP
jgi:hypothetical protein